MNVNIFSVCLRPVTAETSLFNNAIFEQKHLANYTKEQKHFI